MYVVWEHFQLMIIRKTILLLLIPFVIGCKGNNDVPKKVKKSFTSKYKNIEEVVWSMENDLYKAEFIYEEFDVVALYDASGKWLRSTGNIPINKIMVCISEYIGQNYNSPHILKAEFIEDPQEFVYSITIEDIDQLDELDDEQVGSDDNDYEVKKLIFDQNCDQIDELE